MTRGGIITSARAVALATLLLLPLGFATTLAQDAPPLPDMPGLPEPPGEEDIATLAHDALLAGPETVWTSLNDGADSGLDADKLDGFTSEDFFAADAALAQAIAGEAAAREAAIANLADAVANEVAARINAIANLAGALAGETAARTAAIGALAARTAALEGIVNGGNFRGTSLNVVRDITVGGTITVNTHTTHLPWWTLASAPQGPFAPGHVKLETPILANEHNMFRLKILGYRYGIGVPFEIDCAGYAYGDAGLIASSCMTEGTNERVGIGTQNGRVAVTFGSGTTGMYFDHFSAEYVGWAPKAPAGFVWSFVYNTPAPFSNTNNVVIDDRAGTISARGAITANVASPLGDVAEAVSGAGLAPGDVVVMDGFTPLGKLKVKKADAAHSREAVGVVSTDPSLVLAGLATDTPLAVAGVVPVKVVGPIARGDLLATSATPGHAQACKLAGCQGVILGKALESFSGIAAGSVRAIVTLG